LTAANLGDDGKVASGQVLTDEDIAKFKDYQLQTINNQLALDSANRELAFEENEMAKAEVTDGKDPIALLRAQIDDLNLSIKQLTQIAMSTKDPGDLMTPKTGPTAGEWIDIVLDTTKSSNNTSSSLQSKGSFSKTAVNFIFGSYGRSSSSSEGSSVFQRTTQQTDISIGMRATKVVIDRGGWMSPEVLEASTNMYHTGSGSFNDNFKTYPVAFIVVKDVTIKYKFESDEVDDAKEAAEKNAESGGGFLCFSSSSGKSSSSNVSSAFTGSDSEGVTIKIPGPQILMWILEKTPQDNSEPYPEGTSALPPGVKDLLKPKEQTKSDISGPVNLVG